MDTSWLSQMRKGVLELCVLAILERSETYGYAVVEQLGSTPGMEVTESTNLSAVSQAGKRWFAETTYGEEPVRSTSPLYSLSAAGRARLKELSQTWNTIVGSVGSLLSTQGTAYVATHS